MFDDGISLLIVVLYTSATVSTKVSSFRSDYHQRSILVYIYFILPLCVLLINIDSDVRVENCHDKGGSFVTFLISQDWPKYHLLSTKKKKTCVNVFSNMNSKVLILSWKSSLHSKKKNVQFKLSCIKSHDVILCFLSKYFLYYLDAP